MRIKVLKIRYGMELWSRFGFKNNQHCIRLISVAQGLGVMLRLRDLAEPKYGIAIGFCARLR